MKVKELNGLLTDYTRVVVYDENGYARGWYEGRYSIPDEWLDREVSFLTAGYYKNNGIQLEVGVKEVKK